MIELDDAIKEMEERKNVNFWDWLKAVPAIPRIKTNRVSK